MIQMYPEEGRSMEVGSPSLADERRYEYKQLMMRALADVCNSNTMNFLDFE